MTALLQSGLIMAHIQAADSADRLIAVAKPLAERTGARVTGLHVIPPIQVYADAAIAVGTDYTATQVAIFREDADRARKAFETASGAAGLEASWLEINSGARAMVGVAAGACRTADLVLAPQVPPDNPTSLVPNPADLVMESGRPVLVVPAAGTFADIGRRVLVAWNASRESARALFDSLALIQPGATLHLLSIGRPPADEDAYNSTDALAKALNGRSITVETAHSPSDDVTVGEEILSRSSDFGADLIVMGCYGHARLRETIFGGATREILAHMTVPVLMSH